MNKTVFQTKKNLNQYQKLIRRNDRWLCADPSEDTRVMHTKFPAAVKFFGLIAMKNVVLPHFCPQELKVNSFAYVDVLGTAVKP